MDTEQEEEFERQEDAFRHWVSNDGSTEYPAEKDRYHLYISYACPWASRALIVRDLKGLADVVSMSAVDPLRGDERGWQFGEGDGFSPDPINGFAYLSEAYAATDPGWRGRATVPVLWDKVTGKIVNNSEDDICVMFNFAFSEIADSDLNLFPPDVAEEQAEICNEIYENVNNGVYRAGFAGSQSVYARWASRIFDTLDVMEKRLETRRYLMGDRITEVDWRLFCTLVRFDSVYYMHFKCNLRRIVDYPNLWGYLRDLYQQEGIADTVNMDHIKDHYYITHDDINPTQFVPIGPGDLDFNAPHDRDRF